MNKEKILDKLMKLPKPIFEGVISFFQNKENYEFYEGIKIKKYARHLIFNFEKEIEKIKRNRKALEINLGSYSYTYFNVAYLKNVISLILYALYTGYIPVITINANSEWNQREWYFVQPYIVLNVDISEFKIVKCEKRMVDYAPKFNDLFDLNGDDFAIWRFLFKKFIIFNTQTNQYISEELSTLEGAKIGIIIRGTDYTRLKPKDHPIQPTIEEIIEEIEKHRKHNQKIYVATEEKDLFCQLENYFGKEFVLENKRKYYDELYYKNACTKIGEVHFERENDNYFKGLEYLSSITILSKCDLVIGANSGGMQYAAYLIDDVNKLIIINKGTYT